MDSKQLLGKWIDAFKAADIDALIACYAADAVNFQIAAEPVIGIERIQTDFEQFFHAFPDAYSDVENVLGDGDWAAWEWSGGGTFMGEFLGKPPTGRSFKLRGCGFFHFRDGKIVFQRGYWDKETWFSQIALTF